MRRREGGEGQEGMEQFVQDLVGLREDLGFYPQGGGTLEDCGQSRGGA